ncbi:MAG: V-type ATP synthase subunit E [Ruminococcaceae bacterium]|nr:V-type ATP synthase subunit E [Oscillospiraceae bacterium]
MEIQLQALIDQIKRDGVEAAVAEAESVLKAAKEEAEKIISDAKAEAEKLLINAKNENDRMVKSSEDAIRQAGRNLLISFRESVAKEANAIVSENVTAVYSSDAFAQLVLKAVEGWAGKPDAEDISVVLNSEDLKALEDTLLAVLKDKMVKGVTLKANDNFDGGFRIAVNEGGAYYDYSAQAVVDMLSNYLSPKVTALLKEAE